MQIEIFCTQGSFSDFLSEYSCYKISLYVQDICESRFVFFCFFIDISFALEKAAFNFSGDEKMHKNCNEKSNIVCEAKNCVYHSKDSKCTASSIKVGSCNACSCSDTCCDTFKMRDDVTSAF